METHTHDDGGGPPVTEMGTTVFGPLPLLYRVLLVACVLVVMAGGGAWLAHATPLPVAVRAGALLGIAVGAGLSFLLVHDFTQARPVRVPRRHH